MTDSITLTKDNTTVTVASALKPGDTVVLTLPDDSLKVTDVITSAFSMGGTTALTMKTATVLFAPDETPVTILKDAS